MRRLSLLAARRLRLILEQLEDRLVLSVLTIPLDSVADRTGDQIIDVQQYNDPSRSAMSIFDTGSSAITFSAADQGRFTAAGHPIPIKVPGGAVADGIGGRVTGDVSQPGTIIVGGLGAATLTEPDGTVGTGTRGGSGGTGSTQWGLINHYEPNDVAYGLGIQAFIGTPQGSPHLPTLTGTPILYTDPAHPHGVPALITLHGSTIDLSSDIPGLVLSLAKMQFPWPGTGLQQSTGTSSPVTIPLTLQGIDNHLNPGDQVTETPIPYQSSVGLVQNSATVSGQSFLFDTGAQVTLISTATARALGFDLNHPEYFGTVEGVGGNIQVPGYTLDELNMPLSDGGLLRFTHAPVYVLDVAGADGVLGMNLFNRAVQMLYDPYGDGHPSVSITFFAGPGSAPSDGSTPNTLSQLQLLDSALAATIHGTTIPELAIFSGRISGHVFYDYNQDGTMSGTEPGIPNQLVYLDSNGNGRLDPGEPSVLTDSTGAYQFSNLVPGNYTVREVIPSGLASVSATRLVATVAASNGATTVVDFGVLPIQQDPLTAYIASLYGSILDRAPDVSGYNSWMRYLQNGSSRQQVANAIWESPEHRGIQVDGFYQNLLHRAADPASRASFVGAMLNGATEYDVERWIITSPEYQSLHPGDAAFLTALYNDVLGRAIDFAAQSAWQYALQNGMTRDDVARLVLTSMEHELQEVDSYFQSFLHRAAQAADQTIWASYISQSNPTPDRLAEPLLGSDEFFALARQLSST
jgi:hypothetical protein